MATTDRRWKRKIAEVHVVMLARAHGVSIRWVKGRDWHTKAEASDAARQVFIPKPNTPRQYLVALHELGHVVGPIPASAKADYHRFTAGEFNLVCEAAAWGWAVEHLHPELDHRIAQADFEAVVGKGFAAHSWSAAAYAIGG